MKHPQEHIDALKAEVWWDGGMPLSLLHLVSDYSYAYGKCQALEEGIDRLKAEWAAARKKTK